MSNLKSSAKMSTCRVNKSPFKMDNNQKNVENNMFSTIKYSNEESIYKDTIRISKQTICLSGDSSNSNRKQTLKYPVVT